MTSRWVKTSGVYYGAECSPNCEYCIQFCACHKPNRYKLLYSPFRYFPPYTYGGSRRRSFDFTAPREIILRNVGHPSVCGQNPSGTQAASRDLVKTQCGSQSEAPQSRRQSALVAGPKKPLRRISGYPQAVPGLATRIVSTLRCCYSVALCIFLAPVWVPRLCSSYILRYK